MKKFANEYESIVVLTGAGISAESGLKTFRDSDGLWEGHRVEDVATPEAFRASPETVHGFYNARRAQLLSEAKPNQAHIALANFEHKFNARNSNSFTLVTQNVDNLHECAGSENVIHMHGELLKISCTSCGTKLKWTENLNTDTPCPECKSIASLRPDIVWFGEIPYFMGKIQTALANCDLFVSIGTSGNVYPAAGFAQMAYDLGADTVELNLEATNNPCFKYRQTGKASALVPSYFKS